MPPGCSVNEFRSNLAAILCLDVPSSVFIRMYIVQYDAIVEGKCVYICVRYDGIVAEGTQPLHGLWRRAIYLLYSSAIICPVKHRTHVRILGKINFEQICTRGIFLPGCGWSH